MNPKYSGVHAPFGPNKDSPMELPNTQRGAITIYILLIHRQPFLFTSFFRVKRYLVLISSCKNFTTNHFSSPYYAKQPRTCQPDFAYPVGDITNISK